MLDAFLKILAATTKQGANKIIKEAISNNRFRKMKIRMEARNYLTRAYSLSKNGSRRIVFDGKSWRYLDSDVKREALLYSIPYEIFGYGIFEGMTRHNEMTVSREELYKALPLLYRKLTDAGISVYFKGKPVVSSQWDFSFTAEDKEGIDWFEIRPEIFCDNKLVEKDDLRRLLSRTGIIEKDGVIRIIDGDTQEILDTIARIYGKENKKGGDRKKEIIRIPRMQILDWLELRKKGVKIRLSKENEELIERLTRFEEIRRRQLPEKLKAVLRPYQEEGYNWLVFLYEHRFGACLADDMGLGKTLQAIALLAGIKEGKVSARGAPPDAPHLVVLPTSLIFNWENEIGKFYPGLNIHLYIGNDRSDDFKDCDVILTTYGVARRDADKLAKFSFNVIIFDEAQAVKNIYASTTGAVRRLRGYFKLVMTGTPLENHLGEYYSILDLALPGLLGDYDDFKANLKSGRSGDLDLIIGRTKPFVLRRTKEKILKELPEKTENDIYLELTDKQKVLYKKTVEMVKGAISDAYTTKTEAQAQIIALTAILKLRQLCMSPRLVDPGATEKSPKVEFLSGKLRELLDEGHSALVFSQFTGFLDIVEEELAAEGVPYLRLDGSTGVSKRKRLVEGFQSGEGASVFLLSLKAGGQGLNMTRASYVFHLDPWWNPAVENQASDRAHRIGQKNKVTVTRILMHHTVEEKMMKLKKRKLALFKAIMEGASGGKRGAVISKEDFNFLLG